MPPPSRLRELTRRSAEAEIKSFQARPDAEKWKVSFAAKERWANESVARLGSLFEKVDRRVDLKAGVRVALKLRGATVVKATSEAPAGASGVTAGAGAGYSAALAAGGPAAVAQALAGGYKAEDFAQGAMAVYLKLALDLAEESGQKTLEALGLGKTWDWATYRDFAQDAFAVRGSKILQHAYGSHLDSLARMVLRKCDPAKPLTIQQLTKQIREEWPRLTKYEAERIARTEAAAVWERMAHYAMKMNGVETVDWLVAQGPNHKTICPRCLKAKADGPYPVSGPGSLDDEHSPPLHPNCFVAGTLVSGPPPIGSVIREYSGNIIRVTTANGRKITVTPNHPILTTHGWVAAGELNESSYVVCGSRRKWGPLSGNSVQDDDYVPTAIEQIAESFPSQRFGYASKPAIEFHGDTVEGQIYVIRSNSFFQSEVQTMLREPLMEGHGLFCDTCKVSLIREGALNLLGERHYPSSSSIMGGSDCSRSLFRRFSLPHQKASLRGSSYSDTPPFQTIDNYSSGNAEFSGQPQYGHSAVKVGDNSVNGQGYFSSGNNSVSFEDPVNRSFRDPRYLYESFHRHAFHIQTDKVLFVKSYPFSGHVYNLETVDNWYSANGIIAHNCCCTLVPKLAAGWLPPMEPFEGPPENVLIRAASGEEQVQKAFGWTAPPVPKAPVLNSPLVAAIQASGRRPLSAAQIAQRRAAARKRKGPHA